MPARLDNPWLRSVVIVIAAAAAIAIEIFAASLAWLNFRLGRELVSKPWNNPTEIYSRATAQDRLIVKVYGSDWRTTTPVDIGELPEEVANAFIAAEDVRFRNHMGVDPIGMARALVANLSSGSIQQGGSTLNQQLVKSKLLSQERTYRRKIFEGLLAISLDFRLSKDEILEGYLNEIYLGHVHGRPILGIDEGSRVFFGKSPNRLDAGEAALIASIIRAPNRDNPYKRPQLARERRDRVLDEMLDRGWISRDIRDRSKRRPAKFRSVAALETPYAHYLTALRLEIQRELGDSVLRRTGLKIVCEMDPEKQSAAQKAAARGYRTLVNRYKWIASHSREDLLQIAILSADPRTGGVRAFVGGSDIRPQFDRSIEMKRQPGSAFKTFAYLAAIESRSATPATLLLDTPLTVNLASGSDWEPHNYDERFRGRVTLRESFEKSLNVPTVRLSQDIGLGRVVKIAQRFGFEESMDALPALPLGVVDVSMRELTSAYTVFPNLGVRTEPYLLTEVRDPKGKRIFERRLEREAIADPAAAFVVHSLLRGVVRRGTASRLRRYGLSHVAGKTGTTSDYRDAWFVGYTRDLVTTAWVGFDRGAPLRLSSGEAAIPVWALYVANIETDKREIEAPAGVEFHRIDPESGLLWADGCPGPRDEVFLEGTAPRAHCPRGIFGSIVRRILYDDETFDEPSAITVDTFRRWEREAERSRREIESTVDRLRRLFGEDDGGPHNREKKPKKPKRERPSRGSDSR